MKFRRKKKNQNTAIMIDDVVVSSEVLEEVFACDIAACKGACCVEGDLGAPLNKKELRILEDIYATVEPYLNEKGKQAIRKQGVWLKDFTGDFSTPLVNGKECAYVNFSTEGVALCGIEQAYFDGKIPFRKPISCHLYPIRVTKTKEYEALNYDRWDICKAACALGKKNGVRIYEFVKDALIRAYGEEFYAVLEKAVEEQEKGVRGEESGDR